MGDERLNGTRQKKSYIRFIFDFHYLDKNVLWNFFSCFTVGASFFFIVDFAIFIESYLFVVLAYWGFFWNVWESICFIGALVLRSSFRLDFFFFSV